MSHFVLGFGLWDVGSPLILAMAQPQGAPSPLVQMLPIALVMAGEMSAGALNTLHNLSFYLDTMRRIRDAIAFQTFDNFRQEFLRSASRLPRDS